MGCPYVEICGGCPLRQYEQSEYQRRKKETFEAVLKQLTVQPLKTGAPVFIDDATRRRASLAFKFKKGTLTLGFNGARSNDITDIEQCAQLTPELNAVLPELRRLLTDICATPYKLKKGKKLIAQFIVGGDVWLCHASNGIDVVLEYDAPLELEHRMIIFEQAQNWNNLLRISHRRHVGETPEPIIEKAKPFIKNGAYNIYIPGGTFLQPSFAGEKALADLVLKYLGDTRGRIADLFCGVGTFSYYLQPLGDMKITAVDSSEELLSGFRESLNRNQIPNVEIIARNLFKYPLDESELGNTKVVVLDPPRAGAAAQVGKIASFSEEHKPEKIIYVSCNPHTFINDANNLTATGYDLSEVTMVDQFVYSNHSELVALFTKGKKLI